MERYLHDRYGGWATEQGLLLKLVEEIGEVAETVNKRAGIKQKNGTDLQKEWGYELADRIHYLVAIAAINHIDLPAAMLEKDKIASAKYGHDMNLETYLFRQKYE